MGQFLDGGRDWLWSAGGLAGAVIVGLIAARIALAVAGRIARRTPTGLDDVLVRELARPVQLGLPLILVLLVAPALPLPPEALDILGRAVTLGLIATVGWVALALLDAGGKAIAERYRIDHPDNLSARRIRTRVDVMRRICGVIVVTVTIAIMLMTFPSVRHLGISLFASAGIAGIVVGFAARPALSNLIAGLQIALTEPIRIDDVVIVEGEWGWIEEIGTTFVVVRIWDLRRLVVPLSHFIEKPFQNWTRVTADLLGTVFIYADYTVPVEEVRAELHRILQSTPLWNGEAWGLQVTNTTDKTMELRALMSASDSGTAWDLRCLVRERLIAFLQERYPESLPRLRAEVAPPGGGEPRPAAS